MNLDWSNGPVVHVQALEAQGKARRDAASVNPSSMYAEKLEVHTDTPGTRAVK